MNKERKRKNNTTTGKNREQSLESNGTHKTYLEYGAKGFYIALRCKAVGGQVQFTDAQWEGR